MSDPGAGSLEGFTVLDLGGMGPSARCMRILADLGARWIRLVAPSGADRIQPSGHDYGAMRGAELIELDLKAPGAAAVFLRMAERADVIVESFRPGVAARLGIAYARVRQVKPDIVYCAATGYGQDGPYAQAAGHDLNYQAVSGALAAAGLTADGLPAMPGLTLADSAGGGWQAAGRILAALLARKPGEQGAYLDVAASEGVLHLMAGSIDDHLSNGRDPRDGLFAGRYACYGIYKAADERCLTVGALEQKFFANLCQALGVGDLAGRQYDPEAQPALRAALAAAFATRPRHEWLQLLEGQDVCVMPVLSVAEVAEDRHWIARGMFQTYAHPERGETRQLAAFGRDQAGERGEVARITAPDAILASFGFEAAEIETLKGGAVVG